jgi:hypothetical protein
MGSVVQSLTIKSRGHSYHFQKLKREMISGYFYTAKRDDARMPGRFNTHRDLVESYHSMRDELQVLK